MLLRRITKHVKDQNWFAVALDFFIVVAGILIAFQITNWNERARTNAELIRAEAHLKIDIFNNYVNFSERRNLAACRKERIRALGDQLLAEGDEWIPMAFGTPDIGGELTYASTLQSPKVPWGSLIWENELARGTFDSMDNDRQRKIRFIFAATKDAEITQEKISNAESQLTALAHITELSRADRLKYFDIVTQIDQYSNYLEQVSARVIPVIDSLDLQYDAKEVEGLQNFVTRRNDRNASKYGDCFQRYRVPFLERE